ncbi:sensor histidine kinase [Solihabitans fulvus]|uniref:Sensor histidine kinase n=1 Tax=Solihabitans fulvus TaxID=1892852 RepID=A0A5B2X493_9PSEU|nr:sensor histidine kinase [Solihabitans fulvus]KAA2258127.1 sensor histidine kinase [Solihabitans fulvus]
MNAPTIVGSLHHPALLYRGPAEYLAGTVPFVLDGLAAGQPVAVVVPPGNLTLLRSHLGDAAERVLMIDMTEAGRNPGRIIPGVLRAFADKHDGVHVRIIGEPVWASRSASEYPACAQHEALINLAFKDRDVSILCPYDAVALDAVAIADAFRTHPMLLDTDGSRTSPDYAPDRVLADYNEPLPVPPTAATCLVRPNDFVSLRRFAVAQAASRGMVGDRLDDLLLAVTELATNSAEVVLDAARRDDPVTMAFWAKDRHLVCQAHGPGVLRDPLAGRRPISVHQFRGRGLLLVNQLADLVRVHTGPDSTTVRVLFRLP